MVLAEVLHIRPWEIGLLTVDEFIAACDYIDEMNRRLDEASRR